MQVGFDAKRLFNNRTGLGNYSRTLLDNLRRYFPDNEYVLFTPKVNEDEFGAQYSRAFPTVLPQKIGGTYWRSYGVSKDIEQQGIEVFHGLSNELPFRLKGVRKVVTIHDLIFKKLPAAYPFFDRQVYDLKSRKSCRSADLVIAVSESTKRDIIHYYGIPEAKIRVVYQACHPLFYEDKSEAEDDICQKLNLPTEYLLSVGSVIERKNLLQTVKALSALPADLQIPLVVVGQGGDYKQKVLRYLHQNRMSERVIWRDDISDTADLCALYRHAALTLYPSDYEGFGLPVAESLLCKTPVITSDVSSLPEAGGAGAVLVCPQNIEEITAAAEKLLTDSEFARRMSAEGYAYARAKFDPEALTQQIIECYKN